LLRKGAVVPTLHYGTELELDLHDKGAHAAAEIIGDHASRGGWVRITDVDGRQWTLLISPGIPIWLSPDADPAAPVA
jgi:hypothetical protein